MNKDKELGRLLKLIVLNWESIPMEYKMDIRNSKSNIKGLKDDGHLVIFLVDRQKPSVEQSYDFDEERFGINKYGEIVWGFDSGCSCPSPWDDSYPDCYNVSKTWKEFIVADINDKKNNFECFDSDFKEESIKRINEIVEKCFTKLQKIVKDKVIGDEE